jgi:hypothetical protein
LMELAEIKITVGKQELFASILSINFLCLKKTLDLEQTLAEKVSSLAEKWVLLSGLLSRVLHC